MTKKVHFISASLCAALTQLWIFIYTPFWIFSLAIALLFGAIGREKKATYVNNEKKVIYSESNCLTFFLESAAFISAYIAVWGYYKLHTL
jgi:hypothetical protein